VIPISRFSTTIVILRTMLRAVIISILSVFGVFQAQKPVTILFMGDSLTAGYGLTVEESFPSVAGRILRQRGIQTTVINSGISGDTSAGGLARADWVLRQNIDIFFLELGANDGLRGLPVKETRKNLQAIIDKVKKKHPKVKIILAGMMVPPNMGKDYSIAFEQMFKDLAATNRCTRIPFLLEGVGGIAALNQSDGIHPTAKGHQIIGENVAKTIERVLAGKN